MPRKAMARRYQLWPGAWDHSMDGWPGITMELRIAPHGRAMRADITSAGFKDPGPTCGGMTTSVVRSVGLRTIVRGLRGRIVTIWLNERDILDKPSEIIAHEATHAALEFCRFKSVNPMLGKGHEEVLAYTVGVLVRQINRIFYAHAFRRGRR